MPRVLSAVACAVAAQCRECAVQRVASKSDALDLASGGGTTVCFLPKGTDVTWGVGGRLLSGVFGIFA